MPQFHLKVRNALPGIPAGSNVNWSQPPYDSLPDAMPTATLAVTFSHMPWDSGNFILAATGSPAGLHGFASPTLTPREGVTYVWDMAANRVSVEGDGGGDLIAWARANPLLAGAIAVGAYVVLFGGRRGLRF